MLGRRGCLGGLGMLFWVALTIFASCKQSSCHELLPPPPRAEYKAPITSLAQLRAAHRACKIPRLLVHVKNIETHPAGDLFPQLQDEGSTISSVIWALCIVKGCTLQLEDVPFIMPDWDRGMIMLLTHNVRAIVFPGGEVVQQSQLCRLI